MLDFQGSSSFQISELTCIARFSQEREILLLNCFHFHPGHCLYPTQTPQVLGPYKPASEAFYTIKKKLPPVVLPSHQVWARKTPWYLLALMAFLFQTTCSLKYKGFFSISFTHRHALLPQDENIQTSHLIYLPVSKPLAGLQT